MKLSERTIGLLKNFATINQSIYFRGGNRLETIAIAKNIYAETVVDEDFQSPFVIYDLVEFLGALKLFKSPILDFNNAEDNYLHIREENNPTFAVRYVFAPLKHITYPEKRPNLGVTDINFKIDNNTLMSILKASNTMQLPNMVIENVDSKHVDLIVTNIKNTSANKFSIIIDANVMAKNDFSLIFNMDTFKMIPQGYDIGIADGRLSSWYNPDIDYVISLDIKSVYNG